MNTVENQIEYKNFLNLDKKDIELDIISKIKSRYYLDNYSPIKLNSPLSLFKTQNKIEKILKNKIEFKEVSQKNLKNIYSDYNK